MGKKKVLTKNYEIVQIEIVDEPIAQIEIVDEPPRRSARGGRSARARKSVGLKICLCTTCSFISQLYLVLKILELKNLI